MNKIKIKYQKLNEISGPSPKAFISKNYHFFSYFSCIWFWNIIWALSKLMTYGLGLLSFDGLKMKIKCQLLIWNWWFNGKRSNYFITQDNSKLLFFYSHGSRKKTFSNPFIIRNRIYTNFLPYFKRIKLNMDQNSWKFLFLLRYYFIELEKTCGSSG